jgi:hypothetical protein
MQVWTEQDDNLIRQVGSKISLQRLAVRMKRSQQAVRTRARQLSVPAFRLKRLSLQERNGERQAAARDFSKRARMPATLDAGWGSLNR